MQMNRRTMCARTIATSLALTAALCATAASAQESQRFPWKPVRLIVTSQSGNVTDVNARMLASKLSELWGQPVIVEQKLGANGAIGSDYVAKSAPDGHTILVTTTALVQTLALRRNLPYDINKDLAPISETFLLRLGLAVDKKLNVTSLGQFIEVAKQKPGKFSFASFGVGSTGHMVVSKMNKDLGLDITHVPYQGTPAALTAMLGGDVQVTLLDPFIAKPYVANGKLTFLATTGAKRSPYLPDVPTFKQAGVSGFDVDNWCGWFARGGTPQAILDKISADIKRVQQMPEVIESYRTSGIEMAHTTPSEFKQIVQRDAEYWTALVDSTGIKVE